MLKLRVYIAIFSLYYFEIIFSETVITNKICNTKNKSQMARVASRKVSHKTCVKRTAKKMHKKASSPRGHQLALAKAQKACAASPKVKRTMRKRSTRRSAKKGSRKSAKKM